MGDAGRGAMGNFGQYASMESAGHGRSIGELIADVVTTVQEIMRSEVRLARTEVGEEMTKAAAASKMLIAAGVLALFAGAFALVTVFCALILVWPPWLVALIITVVLGAVAGFMLSAGIARWKLFHPKPEKTIETVKENVEWARNQIKS